VAVALLTKPPVTNIVLPGGESVNAAEIASDRAEIESLRAQLAEQANAPQETSLLTTEATTEASTTTQATTTTLNSTTKNNSTIKVTVKTNDGREYSTQASGDLASVPLIIVDAARDIRINLLVENVIVYSVNRRQIGGRYSNERDITKEYDNWGETLFLGWTWEYAFITDKGTHYIQVESNNVFN